MDNTQDGIFGELEDQCTCWVCFEIFVDPITLPCAHTFCFDCATKVQKKNSCCPFCRRPFDPPLPDVNKEIEAMVAQYHQTKMRIDELNEVPSINQDALLFQVPDEVLVDIFSYLPPKQIGKAARACRDLRRISNDAWLWRTLCLRDFPFCSVDRYGKNWRHCYIARSNIHKGWSEGKAGDFEVITMRGHTNYIECFRLYKGKVVSGSADSTLKVWKAESDEPIHTLVGHTGLVKAVEFNELRVVSASADHTAKIWDTSSGVCSKSLSHTNKVNCVQLTDTQVFTGSEDRTAKVWDVRDGSITHTLTHPVSVNELAFTGHHNVVTSCSDAIRVWDLRNPNSILHNFQNPIHFGETHFQLVNNQTLVAGYADSSVREINLQNQAVTHYQNHQGHFPVLHHLQGVTAIQSDGKHVVAASGSGAVVVYNMQTKRSIHVLNEHKGRVNDLQLDDNKIVTAGSDNTLKVWDLSKGKRLYSLLGGSLQKRANNPDHPTRVGCSGIQFDESRIVASIASLLRVYDFEHYKPTE